MEKDLRLALNNITLPYNCDKYCTKSNNNNLFDDNINDEDDINNNNLVKSKAVLPLIVNQPNNVWKNGDIPEATSTTIKYFKNIYDKPYDNLPIYRKTDKQIKENEPHKEYSGTNGLTYYKCSSKNNNINNKYNRILTNIPCNFINNYNLDDTYICKNKPLNGDLTNCSKI